MSNLEERIKILEDMVSRLHKVNIPTQEPEKKIIDLSMMIGSDIDMEFSDLGNAWNIGKLKLIKSNNVVSMFEKAGGWSAPKCRIRQDHWHPWNGGNCPLPEGLEVELKFIDSSYDLDNGLVNTVSYFKTTDYLQEAWDSKVLVAFKVLGTADDACYEWQKEKEE